MSKSCPSFGSAKACHAELHAEQQLRFAASHTFMQDV